MNFDQTKNTLETETLVEVESCTVAPTTAEEAAAALQTSVSLNAISKMKKQTVGDIVNARRIIDGPSDKLRAVSAVRYPWVRPLWDKMRGNRWEIDQITFVRDSNEFPQLPKREQQAFRRSLAFLSNLDSIQTENLALNVSQFITDPSISQLISRQQFEEWIHVEMYSAITETLFEDPLDIYDMYRTVPMLKEKNDFIVAQGAMVTRDPSPENKVKALVSNIALEGVYFFSGFLTIYAINRMHGTLNGATDGIRYIQRDELTHLEIFQNTYLALKQERPEIFTKKLHKECQEILEQAANLEASWGGYVIGDGCCSLTPDIMSDYAKYRTETCAKPLGLGGIFLGVKDPVAWAKDYANINGTQGNFFESKVLTYTENKPKFSRRAKPAPSGVESISK